MLDISKDFDRMMKLAKEDPQALENWRQREIESIINAAPEHMQKRLRGLQFQVDCKRRSTDSAMGACLSVSKMMRDSLHELNSALNGKATAEPAQEETEKPAKVLSFPEVC